MSYRAGIGDRLAAAAGMEAGPPHIVCDGCGARKNAVTKTGYMPQWLLKHKAPPGWLMRRSEDASGNVRREDYCPMCRAMIEKRIKAKEPRK